MLVAAPATAQQAEMELVLALDVSHSIAEDEQRFQIEGIAEAFRDRRLIDAVTGLPPGGMAIAVMIWAGLEQQRLVMPWRVLRSADDCIGFADDLAAAKLERWPGVTYTAIGAALARAGAELASNGIDSHRQVIDISGDDPGNQGRAPDEVRDDLIEAGVVINGLPILSGRIEHDDRAFLVNYYRERVAGGAGAFVMPALSAADFRRAMTAKLIREVSALPPADQVAGNAPRKARNGG
ncbi:MAG: DUF1194 domain-containing protein [Alphaproteobacteria bacterium]